VAEIITVSDLPASMQTQELIAVLVAGANARASRVAPCLVEAAEAEVPTDTQLASLDEAKMVLIGAVKRWADAGSGALASQTAGPFGQTLDTRQRTGYHLWPSEITDLQGICSSIAGTAGRQAFSIDTAPTYSAHLPWCSLSMGADYCSCGADIAGYPIYELD
jgi:hypothetical protein